jgi:hypothetical protein
MSEKEQIKDEESAEVESKESAKVIRMAIIHAKLG